MNSVSIFKYDNYKEYLDELISSSEKKGRGLRGKLADLLSVQSSYISQVLAGVLHFSPEQVLLICEFFALSREESHFLLLLIQKERAGSVALKKYYQEQIDSLRVGSKELAKRFRSKKELTADEVMIYYSQWYYAVVHILVSIPKYANLNALVEITGLSEKLIKEILSFLISTGLVVEEKTRYQMGDARMHLGGQNAMISKHHTNWRIQSLKSLEIPLKEDVHYTSIVSVSKSDAEKLREEFLSVLEKYNRVVAKSPEEECHCLSFDFFRIDRSQRT